ncbi:MAG TPA: hypothetical protein VN634_14870 [Candidatus Limnocylindrales bacterium]|nr:hypothetical protein [Candidatus Limnocylindrales bacterium]
MIESDIHCGLCVPMCPVARLDDAAAKDALSGDAVGARIRDLQAPAGEPSGHVWR